MTRPEAFSSETPRSRAIVGATSMFSTIVNVLPGLMPEPDVTKSRHSSGGRSRETRVHRLSGSGSGR